MQTGQFGETMGPKQKDDDRTAASNSKRRLFLGNSGTTAANPINKKVSTTLRRSPRKAVRQTNNTHAQTKRVGMKREHSAFFEEIHPIKKKPRISPPSSALSSKIKSSPAKCQAAATTKSPKKKSAGKGGGSPVKHCTVVKTANGSATPSKDGGSNPGSSRISVLVEITPLKFEPIAGLMPRVAPPVNSRPTVGQYFQSPDAALIRPYKKTYSQECIRRLAVISPDPVENGEGASEKTDEETADGKSEETDGSKEEPFEMFPTGSKATRKKKKKAQANYCRLNFKQNRHSRAPAKLKGAALKRFVYKKKFGLLKNGRR